MKLATATLLKKMFVTQDNAWRLIFEAQKGILTFDFAGDDDEMQNYLRRKR